MLELGELQVVVVVGEEVKVVEGAVEGPEEVREVALEEPLGLAAEVDELGPDLLDPGAQARDIDRVRRDAKADQLS